MERGVTPVPSMFARPVLPPLAPRFVQSTRAPSTANPRAPDPTYRASTRPAPFTAKTSRGEFPEARVSLQQDQGVSTAAVKPAPAAVRQARSPETAISRWGEAQARRGEQRRRVRAAGPP